MLVFGHHAYRRRVLKRLSPSRRVCRRRNHRRKRRQAAQKSADGKEKQAAGENLDQRKEGDVGQNEQLSYRQSKVSAEMTELEERPCTASRSALNGWSRKTRRD